MASLDRAVGLTMGCHFDKLKALSWPKGSELLSASRWLLEIKRGKEVPPLTLIVGAMRDGCSEFPPESPQLEIAGIGFDWSTPKMHVFEVRPVLSGFELRGGPLTEPMVFREDEPRPAIHLVGFLSQKEGGELRIFNAAGEVIVTRHYEAVIPMDGAVGGLRGPKSLN